MLISDNKEVTCFIDMIQKKFPEISIKGNNSLRGIVDGKFQSIRINNRFIKKVEELSKIYRKYGYLLTVKEKGEDKPKEMSIGEFLDMTNKLKPRIITRYKGLTPSPFKNHLIAGKFC